MQKTRFPKTVEFLRNTMLGKEGYDLALAQELTQLVNELGTAKSKNEQLLAENEALSAALKMAQDIIEGQDEEYGYPVFPDDFYQYGEDAMSYQPSDEEIQELVEEVYDVPLEDGQYVEQSVGDTIVLKFRDGDVETLIVAQGYSSYVIEDEDTCCGDPFTYCPNCPDK